MVESGRQVMYIGAFSVDDNYVGRCFIAAN